jgi:hypothetical protein
VALAVEQPLPDENKTTFKLAPPFSTDFSLFYLISSIILAVQLIPQVNMLLLPVILYTLVSTVFGLPFHSSSTLPLHVSRARLPCQTSINDVFSIAGWRVVSEWRLLTTFVDDGYCNYRIKVERWNTQHTELERTWAIAKTPLNPGISIDPQIMAGVERVRDVAQHFCLMLNYIMISRASG